MFCRNTARHNSVQAAAEEVFICSVSKDGSSGLQGPCRTQVRVQAGLQQSSEVFKAAAGAAWHCGLVGLGRGTNELKTGFFSSANQTKMEIHFQLVVNRQKWAVQTSVVLGGDPFSTHFLVSGKTPPLN